MEIPKDKKNLVVLILLCIIGAFVVYYTSIRPMIRQNRTPKVEEKNAVSDLPTAKTIDIMGKGINNKEVETTTPAEEEAINTVFEERMAETANTDIPSEYNVDLFDNSTDAERKERILQLQQQYEKSNSDFLVEMARKEMEEEKRAIQKEANTYKELYEQSVSDNNALAKRVQEKDEIEGMNDRQWLKVTTKRGNVVSSLGDDGVANDAFFGGGRSSSSKEEGSLRNALKATIQQTITVKNGDILPIRLTEDAYVGSTVLRAGTIVNGIVNLRGNRLDVVISSIEHKGHIMEVRLSAYDIDAQKGIYVPEGDLAQVVSEAKSALGDGIVQATTSSAQGFTLNSSAKDAAMGIVTRGVVAGIGGMLKGKERVPTVTIRSGYKLFLMNDGQMR